MNRSVLLGTLVCGFVLLVLASVPALARDTATKPPEPSYSDEWSKSSPFLDLRNDVTIDSPEPPTAPDEPEVDTITLDGDTVAIKEPEIGGDTSETEAPEGGEHKKAYKPDTAVDTVPVDNASKRASADTSQPTGSTDTATKSVEKEPPSAGKNASRQSVASNEQDTRGANYSWSRDENFFEKTGPVTADPPGLDLSPLVTTPGFDTVALGPLRREQKLEAAASMPYGSPVWFRWYHWLIAGGVVVTLIIGMFFWFRQPRVEVIRRDYSSADDFFEEQLRNRRQTSRPEFQDLSSTTNRVDSLGSVDETSGSSEPPIDYERLLKGLHDAGFNGDYEKILQLYYRDGLSQEDIAERTSRGYGEVGLVLDYVDRLRKD